MELAAIRESEHDVSIRLEGAGFGFHFKLSLHLECLI